MQEYKDKDRLKQTKKLTPEEEMELAEFLKPLVRKTVNFSFEKNELPVETMPSEVKEEVVTEIKPKHNRFKRRNANDKIMDNKYNRGEIDYMEYSDPKIDESFRMGRLNESYDSYDHYRMMKLNEQILDIYSGTIWDKSYDKNKRIPKQELSEVYFYIKDKLTDTTYTNAEIFITIAQFLDVNMNILYNMVGPAYKEELVEEMRIYRPKLIKDKIAPLF